MLIERLQGKLQCWEDNSLTRKRMVISETDGNKIRVDSEQCVNFCSNDYLGLAKHPKIIESFIKGVQRYGFGSGASGMVSGYYADQQTLESRFAEWLKVDKAIFFSSGYLANIGTIGAIADRNCTILSDKLSHASLLDGIQLSRAKHYRYQHNVTADLKRLSEYKRPDLIVTESVFSMEGSIAPVQEIMSIAEKHGSSLLIDDAHGVGVLGERGRGICEYAQIDINKLACLILPLGKAFNAMGAIVAGRHEVIASVLQFARSYRYSTALPPAICTALLTTLDIIIAEAWRRRKLMENIKYFTENALARSLPLSSQALTPIKSIIIGNTAKVVQIQQKLLSRGFFISCIRPPTVPKNTARIRVTLNCLHTEKQIINLLDNICALNFS
jgi:8-amino-7-oxononanoate synthase